MKRSSVKLKCFSIFIMFWVFSCAPKGPEQGTNDAPRQTQRSKKPDQQEKVITTPEIPTSLKDAVIKANTDSIAAQNAAQDLNKEATKQDPEGLKVTKLVAHAASAINNARDSFGKAENLFDATSSDLSSLNKTMTSTKAALNDATNSLANDVPNLATKFSLLTKSKLSEAQNSGADLAKAQAAQKDVEAAVSSISKFENALKVFNKQKGVLKDAYDATARILSEAQKQLQPALDAVEAAKKLQAGTSTPAADPEKKKVYLAIDSTVNAIHKNIPAQILSDFTLVKNMSDLKDGGNVLIVTGTSGERIFQPKAIEDLINDAKGKNLKPTVLALRLSGIEVDPEDYGIPQNYNIGLFRIIVSPAGALKDNLKSTQEGISGLKKHLLAP